MPILLPDELVELQIEQAGSIKNGTKVEEEESLKLLKDF